MDPETIKTVTEVTLQVIGAASIIAAVTPNPIDNAVLVFLKGIINMGAFNILNAKNKEPKKDA